VTHEETPVTHRPAVSVVLPARRWRAVIRCALAWTLATAASTSAVAATAAGGSSHSVVVKSDATVWAWGQNSSGQLGDGTTTARRTPVQVPGLTGVIAVAVGNRHTLALTSAGVVWAWGLNTDGQLGDGTTTQRTSPFNVGLTSIVAIAAGDAHSVALASDGTVWVWGQNTYGQLGDGTTTRRLLPQVVSNVQAAAIGAGYGHTLIAKADGTAWAWGANWYGQLGDASTTQRTTPVQMSGVSNATGVAAGMYHSLVLRSTGTVLAAGQNTYGQLGDASWTQRTTAVAVSGLSTATAITANLYSAGARLSDGTVRLWGGNGSGTLGDGTVTNRNTPVSPGLTDVSVLALGSTHALAVTATGVVYSWGSNGSGELGDGTTVARYAPAAISEAGFDWLVATPALSVASGTYYAAQTVVVTNATAGAEMHYTLTGADPTVLDTVVASGGSVVIDHSQTLKVRAFKTGQPSSRIATGAYVLVAWAPTLTPGSGTYTSPPTVTLSTSTPGATIRYTTSGSDPTDTSPAVTGPLAIPTTTTLKAAAFKVDWTTSSVTTGVYTMNFGTLAAPTISPAAGPYTTSVTVTLSSPTPGAAIRYTTNGTTPTTSSPLYLQPLTVESTLTITARAFHPDYVASGSSVAAYTIVVAAPTLTPAGGTYGPGQAITVATATPGATITYTLNESEPTSTSTPIASGGTVSVGRYTLKARAWKTGCTASTTTTATYDVSAAAATPRVAGGAEHSLAVRADGLAWAWGNNGSAQLGDGTTTGRLLPVIVGGLTGIAGLAGGDTHSLALTSTGTVWAWGANGYGQLGDGTTTTRSLPVALGSLSTISSIAAGGSHSVAVKADGTVAAWGANANGQVGDGTTTTRTAPAAILSLSGIVAVAAGAAHTLALAGDGTVWAWGSNGNGQLGDGTTTGKTQPVHLTSLTNVVGITAGGYRSLAVKSDGTVWQWGQIVYGIQRTTPELVSGLSGAVGVAAGGQHSMVLTTAGTVWCWGTNTNGQLGDGTVTERLTPVQASGLTGIVGIAGGGYHSLALAADGTVYTWGRNTLGQLGDGLTTTRTTPAAVSGPAMQWTLAAPTLSLAAGLYYTAQTTTITHPDAGAVLHYTTTGADPAVSDPVIASGGSLSVTVSETLKVRAWKPGAVTSPLAVAAYELKVVAPTITPDTGAYGTAQSATSSTTTTGAVLRYTLDGREPTVSSPTVPGAIPIAQTATLKVRAWKDGWTPSATAFATYWISSGPVSTPAIQTTAGPTADSALVTLTCATEGAIVRYTVDGADPVATSAAYQHPFLLVGTTTVKARAFRFGFTPSAVATTSLALDQPGVAATPVVSPAGGRFAVGRSVTIQAASGATVRYSTDGHDPTDTDPIVSGPLTIDRSLVLKVRAWQSGLTASAVRRADFLITGAVVAGRMHSLALDSAGQVWAWGRNDSGQVGNGGIATQLTPVVVLTGAVAIAANEYHSVAVKADGTVWSWGSNGSGQLGDGTTNARWSPVQVPGLTGIVAVATGPRHTLALTAAGTLRAWGANEAGQLGDGTTTSRLSPVEVPALAGVSSVAAGDGFSLAVQADGSDAGTVWSWGQNAGGQLGDGSLAARSRPGPVIAVPAGVTVVAGTDWALARAADGSVWSWGANANGQLGVAGVTTTATPVRVQPLDQLTGTGAGVYHALATDTMGRAWGWGLDLSGQLTDRYDLTGKSLVPRLLAGVSAPLAMAGGVWHSLVVGADGAVWTFGENSTGQLGDGTQTPSFVPVSASGLVLLNNAWLLGDPDKDGLPTWREVLLGTDPLNADSNGNGVPDGVEAAAHSANADTDGDGVPDALELLRGTDPFLADTDGDGVNDRLDAYPLDPSRWQALTPDPNDHTPPVITLIEPTNARRIW
jgi:alpha-tubulin suppressor-like RCC1 family protein